MMTNAFFRWLLYTLGVLLVVLILLAIAVKIYDVSDLTRGAQYPQRTVSATGEARITVKPDTAVLSYDIVAEGKNEAEVQGAYLKKFAALTRELAAMGIDSSRIMTTMLDMSRDDAAEKSKRYKATMTVQIKIEDKKTIDETIKKVYDVALKNELKTSPAPYGSQCASFKDQTEYFTPQIRRRAAENAWENAQNVVAAAGLALGRVVSVNDYTSTIYYPIQGSCSAPVPGIPLAPTELVQSINVIFEVK